MSAATVPTISPQANKLTKHWMQRISAAVTFRDKTGGATNWASYRAMSAKCGGTVEAASVYIMC